MELHVGDVVEFKKYEDADEMVLSKSEFPSKGTISEIVGIPQYFFIENSPYCFSKSLVERVLKHKKNLKYKPEKFIVQDDYYSMYIIGKDTLSYDKSRAKVYNSRNEANEVAADMHLNAWEVIPYGD